MNLLIFRIIKSILMQPVESTLARILQEGNGISGNCGGCTNIVNGICVAMACAILFQLRSHNSGTPDRQKTIQVQNAGVKTA